MKEKKFNLLLLISSFTLLWGIQVIDLRRFMADDSYFYLVVARNIALHGEQTFSGIIPTNGVHPLWLYILSLWDWMLSKICTQCLFDLRSVLPINLGILALGVWASWKVAEKLGVNTLLFTTLPLGFLSAFSMFGSEAFTSYASIMVLTLLALDTDMNPKKWAVALGFASAAVFLARLDSIFFVMAFYVWLWFRVRDINLWGISAAITASFAVIYVLSNIWFFGGVVPVSGWLKSTFPIWSVKEHYIETVWTQFFGYNFVFGILPIITAAILFLFFRRKTMPDAGLIYVFFIGSVLHFIYTAGFTNNEGTTWMWYYVLPVVMGVLLLSLAIKGFFHIDIQGQMAGIFIGIAFCVFFKYASLPFLWNLQPSYRANLVLTYLRENQINDSTILISDYPGEVAFFSSNHILALDMLTANQYFVNEMLAAPNDLQFILDKTALLKQPATYLFFTTSLEMASLSVSDDFENVNYSFLIPGSERERSFSAMYMGKPVYQQADLVVWKTENAKPIPAP